MPAKYPPVQYNDYLKIDEVTSLQFLKSEEHGMRAHDEHLFIITHQVYELWFKQILVELDSVLPCFQKDQITEAELSRAVSRFTRIIEIQKLMIDQIRVLETMTPLDFLEFRDVLFPASGFQSFQFRLIETKLGLRNEDRLNFNDQPFWAFLKPVEQTKMQAVLKQKSLIESVEAWLERTPFLETDDFRFWQSYQAAVQDMLKEELNFVTNKEDLSENEKKRNYAEIDESQRIFSAIFDPIEFKKLQAQNVFRLSSRAVQAALLINLYRDEPVFQMPFRFLTCLMDVDELFTTWRYRHALMAYRMIGRRIGTGGSSGDKYLRSSTEKHKVFSDFFNLTSFFIPRSKLAPIPQSLKAKLGFFYGTN